MKARKMMENFADENKFIKKYVNKDLVLLMFVVYVSAKVYFYKIIIEKFVWPTVSKYFINDNYEKASENV